jgi:hypothetical protein
MKRSLSYVFVVLMLLSTSAALLQVSIALGANRPFGDSPQTTQTVRSYFASVNSYLDGEDVRELPFSLDEDSSAIGADNGNVILGAIRSTYPHLQLVPGEISGSGDLALAQVAAVNGAPSVPSWINDGVGQPYPTTIDSFRIEDGKVVERLSSGRIGVLSQTVAGTGIDFELDAPGILKVAELEISAPGARGAFVAVSGPGFVVPLEGAFEVAGNGKLLAVDPWTGKSQQIPTGEKIEFSGESILVIPGGQAVLWNTGSEPIRLMLQALVPAQPESHSAERYVSPRGSETFEDVLNRLTVEDGRTEIWFGAVRILGVAPREIQPGIVAMDFTRIVVPAGETVRLSPQGHQVIALLQGDAGWSGLDSLEATSASDELQILETVRACWRGSTHAAAESCRENSSSF